MGPYALLRDGFAIEVARNGGWPVVPTLEQPSGPGFWVLAVAGEAQAAEPRQPLPYPSLTAPDAHRRLKFNLRCGCGGVWEG